VVKDTSPQYYTQCHPTTETTTKETWQSEHCLVVKDTSPQYYHNLSAHWPQNKWHLVDNVKHMATAKPETNLIIVIVCNILLIVISCRRCLLPATQHSNFTIIDTSLPARSSTPRLEGSKHMTHLDGPSWHAIKLAHQDGCAEYDTRLDRTT